MDAATADAIKAAVKELIAQIAPNASFAVKYGGEVICPDPTDQKTFVGGLFTYKNHVSLEFSQGATLDDPNGALEGSGKSRRHLKFYSPQEVKEKGTAALLVQTLAMP